MVPHSDSHEVDGINRRVQVVRVEEELLLDHVGLHFPHAVESMGEGTHLRELARVDESINQKEVVEAKELLL